MPKRNLPEEPPSEGAPEWMTTYSDLVTLLMCFFVLLFSMAVIDKQKFVEVANSLRSTFQNTQSGGNTFESNSGNAIVSIFDQNSWSKKEMPEDAEEKQEAEEKKINEIKEKLEASIKKQNLEKNVSIIDEERTVILRMDSTVLFDSGKAEIKVSGKEIIKKTGDILKQLDNEIIVQGHTDNLPISTSLFPSNWELSTKRATNVVLYLINNTGMRPEFLTATGNGEYKPIAPNDNESGRQKNRRIDIIIIKNQ